MGQQRCADQPDLKFAPRTAPCRFSDAGGDEPSTRSGGRRLKSAKARNRGKWGTVGAAGSMGI